MLKNTPSRARRALARVALPLAIFGVAASAWSSTPPGNAGKPEYQVHATIAASDGHDADVVLCTYEGVPATVQPTAKDGQAPWHIAFTVQPDTKKDMVLVTVQGESDDGHHRVTSRQVVGGKPGEPMAVRFGADADTGLRTVRIVPLHGCPVAARKTT